MICLSCGYICLEIYWNRGLLDSYTIIYIINTGITLGTLLWIRKIPLQGNGMAAIPKRGLTVKVSGEI